MNEQTAVSAALAHGHIGVKEADRGNPECTHNNGGGWRPVSRESFRYDCLFLSVTTRLWERSIESVCDSCWEHYGPTPPFVKPEQTAMERGTEIHQQIEQDYRNREFAGLQSDKEELMRLLRNTQAARKSAKARARKLEARVCKLEEENAALRKECAEWRRHMSLGEASPSAVAQAPGVKRGPTIVCDSGWDD